MAAESPEQREQRRLDTLRSLAVLDSGPEELFDRAAAIAAATCRTPIALVSFVDEERQWFKACVGLDLSETPRSVSFCAHAIASAEPTIVPDARLDARFSDNPLVVGPPYIRFYAGAPITVGNGTRLGSMCVIDTEPRDGLDATQQEVLTNLAAMLADAVQVRRQALAAADASQARAHLAAIVQSSRDAILSKALDGTIVSWNPAAEALYGYRADEVVGSSIARIIPPDRIDEMRAVLDQVAAGGVIDHLETVRVRKDGRHVPVLLTISPIRNDDGEVVGASTIARDITEQKRLEAELHAARDQAMESSRLKSEFLATMSHEIRTPLNGVVGMIGLLVDSDLDPEQRRYAETANRSADALMSVLNDILDFSKIEAGRLDLEVIRFDLRLVMDDVAEILAERAHAKQLELVVVVEPDVPDIVRGDPGRVRQVLLNLVSNAIKFTESGEIVVRADVVEKTSTQVCVRIAVRDTGVGIEAAALGSLFEPFTQADASTTRHYGGTGLGLAIAARLAELMGGSLEAESEPGRGSTFSFTIRLEKDTSPPPALSPVRTDLDGVRVLIVDDNATNRTILENQVAAWGMKSVSVSSGSAALRVIDEAVQAGDGFDVALLDLGMPDMDGLALASNIRSRRTTASLPIVLLTSTAVRGAADAARQVGIDAFLPKPVRQSQLFDAIATVLGSTELPTMVTRHTLAESRARRQPRVLVAEDNPVNQQVVAAMLAKLGYRADIVGNGAEAIDAIGRRPYGAVLMDCQMPEMDGYAATSQIRTTEAPGTRLPIIALTAGAMAGEREKCFAAGMDDYLTKPINVALLERTLRRWVGNDGDNSTEAVVRQPDPIAEALLDDGQVAELRGFGADAAGRASLAQLVQTYVETGQRRVGELGEAVAAGDLDRAATLGHSLAGSSANMGARTVARLARQVEQAAVDGVLDTVAELTKELGDAFPATAAALTDALVTREQS